MSINVISCHTSIVHMYVDGGRGNVQNDTGWNWDATDFDCYFLNSGGKNC